MIRSATIALGMLTASLVSCREHAVSDGPAHVAATPTVSAALAPTVMDASAPTSPAPLPDVATDWCLDGWRGLDEGTCYLVPDEPARVLLVYLSGIVPPTPRSMQKENVQRVVAAAARRAHAVVLLPRGRRGIGPAHAKDWWAWPTGQRDHETHAATMIAEWSAARAKLEDALGPFDRVYLAGSSSGAYFIAALALGGAVEMNGYAAISGGSAGFVPDAGTVTKRPFYVGYGTEDATNGGPKALAAALAARGWPVRVAAHPVGHGAREVYLDEAFAFWNEAASSH